MATTLTGRTIGFIGLGLMGRPMARNLKAAGAAVVVHNRSPGPADELAAEGMVKADSPADVAGQAPVIILMLSDTDAVEAVVTGTHGILDRLKTNALVIDMGTTEPLKTRELADRVHAARGHWVDAPVSGGEVGARDATLSIMAGGSDGAMAEARPILEVLGRRTTHIGDIGTGQIAKAANQMIVAITITAVAESLSLAKAAGADPKKVREALTGGFADSRILELHGARMLEGTFEPGGKSATQLKDLEQAVRLAGQVGHDIPVTTLVRDLYRRLVEQGGGGLDHSGVLKLYADRL